MLRASRFVFVALAFFASISIALPKPAHALDKRLKLMFKTGGYGAAAGAVIGAGTIAMGLGGYQNLLMGASSGLYAGILLAGYIVATQEDSSGGKGRQGPRNPYSPKKPVRDGDWEHEPEENYREMLPREPESEFRLLPENPLRLATVSTNKFGAERNGFTLRQVVVWMPMVTLQF